MEDSKPNAAYLLHDHLEDARVRLGAMFKESVLYRACLQVGYGTDSERKARELSEFLKHSTFVSLPKEIKKFILDVCDGQHAPQGIHGCAETD